MGKGMRYASKIEEEILAWAHVVDATGAELLAKPIGSSKAEISDGHPESAIEAENVLGFKVPVINAERMAIFDGIKKLKENVLNKVILAEVATMMQDLREEVSVGGVVHDEVCVVVLFHNPVVLR